MIYLYRYTRDNRNQLITEIAAVEHASGAEKYEARGYSRCTREAFRALWQMRDSATLRELRADAIEAGIRAQVKKDLERAVGDKV